MYKLTHFRATNIKGFVSGLGKKTFDLDLTPFKSKDILVILGDNATGKSTFLSLVHPWHVPTDGRTKFVESGKEGSLIRTYEGDDGTTIISKCYYHPKSDGGHTPKCFLTIIRQDGEEIELNSNGNVSSYYDLLYTYFGLTKDYINFASYNDSIGTIIRMNDTERKNSVASMVPNTVRFETAYNSVNDKYRELRNTIRNLAQKILSIRDEDSLKADIKRVTKELDKAKTTREDSMQKFARSEGRIRELTHGKKVDVIMQEYNQMTMNLAQYDSDLVGVQAVLLASYDKLGIEPAGKDTINFPGMDRVPNHVLKYEKKIARSEADLRSAHDRIDRIKAEISKYEKSITESETLLFSLQTQDVEELRTLRRQYEEQVAGLRYTKMKDEFEGLEYSEAIALSKSLAMLDQMIQSMYDEYGELVSQFFTNPAAWMESHDEDGYRSGIQHLNATIETTTARKDVLYRKIIEKEQYRQLQDILEKRPRSCTIDSCPFIANALKWKDIAGEIEDLKEQYQQLNVELGETTQRVEHFEQELAFRTDVQHLLTYIIEQGTFIQKYLGSTVQDVYQSISTGMWSQTLDILRLKQVASILSEKEYYIRLTTQLIPDIDHSIEVAKVYGTNRDLLLSQIEQAKDSLTLLREELDAKVMSIIATTNMRDAYTRKLDLWRCVADGINRYRELAESRISIHEAIRDTNRNIETINELLTKCREYDAKIRDAESTLHELEPALQQMQMDLRTLTQLKADKLKVETDFVIVDMIRSIIQPGKGIRKELINIYMYDIYQTANELLLSTFNGNLYLREFIITDKEFTIPYVYNGSEGFDISYASSAQQSIITTAISLAVISKMVDKYGIIAADELDRALSPAHKEVFIDILTKQARYIGINQLIMISHSPEYYEPYDVGFICFPGGKLHGKNLDVIKAT